VTLNCNIKSRDIYSGGRFRLKIGDSSFTGERLEYNLNGKEIVASNIEANLSY